MSYNKRTTVPNSTVKNIHGGGGGLKGVAPVGSSVWIHTKPSRGKKKGAGIKGRTYSITGSKALWEHSVIGGVSIYDIFEKKEEKKQLGRSSMKSISA